MANADFTTLTFGFAGRIVRLFQALPKDEVSRTLGCQLLCSGTSVGDNARASKRARSRADFVAKMGIVEVGILKRRRIEALRTECEELLAYTIASIKTARSNSGKTK